MDPVTIAALISLVLSLIGKLAPLAIGAITAKTPEAHAQIVADMDAAYAEARASISGLRAQLAQNDAAADAALRAAKPSP